MTVFSICKVILTSPMSEASQSLLLLVSGTGTLVVATCGIEVISYRERYAACEVIAVFAVVDISTIESPPLAVAFSQVVGLEIDCQPVVEERLAQPCANGHKAC